MESEETRYKKAIGYFNSNGYGSVKKSIIIFFSLNKYKDSKYYLDIAKDKIINLHHSLGTAIICFIISFLLYAIVQIYAGGGHDIGYILLLVFVSGTIFSSVISCFGYSISQHNYEKFFNKYNLDVRTYDKYGFDKDGYDKDGYNKDGFNMYGNVRTKSIKSDDILDFKAHNKNLNFVNWLGYSSDCVDTGYREFWLSFHRYKLVQKMFKSQIVNFNGKPVYNADMLYNNGKNSIKLFTKQYQEYEYTDEDIKGMEDYCFKLYMGHNNENQKINKFGYTITSPYMFACMLGDLYTINGSSVSFEVSEYKVKRQKEFLNPYGLYIASLYPFGYPVYGANLPSYDEGIQKIKNKFPSFPYREFKE